MDAERWRRLQPILDEALDLAGDDRRRYVDRACAGDAELRVQVEALLAADAETGGALDEPTGALFEDALRAADSRAQVFGGALLPGTRVADRYRIVSLQGRGGMGEVYRADDLKLGQAVALKFLPLHLQQRPEYLERLLEEAKLARQVSHPNVCRVYDIGEWRGRHFLTMEYIDGEDLASLVTRIGRLPEPKALDVARQLCAGLDAAHQLGILHRDLKPSNVMLDGRGRIRVTDFGLAVAAAGLADAEARAGTPAYMAPEQLDGKRATARSDIYALGLVLYELFTGRPAYPAGALHELRRAREESSPTRPSQLIAEFNPAVERAILRCLENDPTLRPASAREVALLLPGGDPIAAALAAGDTPSPDLIAASGPDGVLRPAVALGVLGATLVMLIVLVLLVDRASIIGRVAWPRSAAALEDNARGILERLGYRAARVDSADQITNNPSWITYVARTDTSAGRWAPLGEPGQQVIGYYYRQAPRPLVPLGRSGVVSGGDPPHGAGDARVGTDLRGRLVWLAIAPPDAAPARDGPVDPDWSALFREAGLDPRRFVPVAPTRNPTADSRAAWSGVLPDFGGVPTRVEAAAYRGQPVFFELVMPWDAYWKPEEARAQIVPAGVLRWVWLFVIVLTVATMIALAIRHWLSARGDRRGAFRVALAVFACRFLVWVFGGHHVVLLPSEWVLALNAVGQALVDAAAAWTFYLALEPYGRRLHPRLLVSWTRLLRGRPRDPLVGRDILYGTAAATLLILFWGELVVIIPDALHMPRPPLPVPNPLGPAPFLSLLRGGPINALLGGRHVPEAVLTVAIRAFGMALLFFMSFLGLSLLLRRRALTIGAVLALGTVLPWTAPQSEYQPIGLMCSLAGAIVIVWALRTGLVGTLALFFCLTVWMGFPVTANADAPHFGIGLIAVLMIAALGIYGALIASRAGWREPLLTQQLRSPEERVG